MVEPVLICSNIGSWPPNLFTKCVREPISQYQKHAIALSLDIRHLVEEQWQAMQQGDWRQVASLNGAIDSRAKLIQHYLLEMKRLGAVAVNGRASTE